jgi:hypothetical protein
VERLSGRDAAVSARQGPPRVPAGCRDPGRVRARPGAVASSLTYAGKEQRRRSVSLGNLDAAVVASCGLGRKPAAYLGRDMRDAC